MDEYIFLIDGVEKRVGVEQTPEGYRIVVDGEKIEVTVRSVSGEHVAVSIGDEHLTVEFGESTPEGLRVRVRDQEHIARLSRPKEEKKEVTVEGGEGALTAPMPGTVLRVMKRKGEKVRAGEPMLTIEAMKMENEIRAPTDGVVAEIKVKEGDAVNKGEVLAVIAPEGGE